MVRIYLTHLPFKVAIILTEKMPTTASWLEWPAQLEP